MHGLKVYAIPHVGWTCEAARRRFLAELAEDFSTYIGSLSLKDLTELL